MPNGREATDSSHTAYVAVGRCEDARRGLERLDQGRGLTQPSADTRAILGPCEGPS